MRALKYIGIVAGGFICGFLFYGFVLAPKDYWNGYRDGREYGVVVGRREAAEAIQKEFGTYDSHKPSKFLLEADTSELVSIETNGVQTIRNYPLDISSCLGVYLGHEKDANQRRSKGQFDHPRIPRAVLD
jgi:hypothetical protein